MTSPYTNFDPSEWPKITNRLVAEHPLDSSEIVDCILASWDAIFASKMGIREFKIGKDIFPKPQMMGFFLQEFIVLELAARYPTKWRGEESKADKDIVYIPDINYSIELKTSSSPNRIYGNRSYTQANSKNKKVKFGYYLAVNFEKFSQKFTAPAVRLIRFGWLDLEDWVGQKAATGQQARLMPETEKSKLLELYRKP